MRPVVGVMPLWDEQKDSLWMLPGYLDGLRHAGALPVILPLTTEPEELSQLLALCDGLLLTGGQDVSPALYGEAPLEGLVCCPERDEMDRYALRLAMEQGKPVLGICRGLQLINVALGGTLWQDLPSQRPGEICHRQQPPYDVPSHPVQIGPGTPLAQCLGTDLLPVNSCHHQGIKTAAPGLEIMGTAPDGLPEAVFLPDYPFLWAVQWHPEFLWQQDDPSRRIFRAFTAAMETR